MNRRVMLTGGAGFVGSHLVRACLQEGWQVGVLYLPQEGLASLAPVIGAVNTYPVSGPTEDVFDAVRRFAPDLVFHLASVFLAEHKPQDVLTLIQSNIAFGTQVVDAMSNLGVRLLVNTGTSWQHYQDNDYNPVNLYAATKQAFEDIVEFYVQRGNMRAITLELFDTYGPDDHRPKLFQLLDRAAREGSRLDMSPGEQFLDLVHVVDVVSAYLLAAQRLFAGEAPARETFTVSSGAPLSLRQVVETYQRATGYNLAISWGGRPYREREVFHPWSRGRNLPGWKATIGLEEGIKTLSGLPGWTG